MESKEDNQKLWAARIAAWKESGMSGSRWAREQNLPYNAFQYWRRKLTNKNQSKSQPHFVELRDQPSRRGSIELEMSGCVIRIQGGYDPSLLHSCLLVLRKLAC